MIFNLFFIFTEHFIIDLKDSDQKIMYKLSIKKEDKMKKVSLIFIAFMFAGVCSYAQTEYVVKQEFQEKTKNLGAQVSSIQKTNSNLNKDLGSMKNSIGVLQNEVKTLEVICTQNVEALKTYESKTLVLKESFMSYKKKTKMLLILELLLLIIALGYVFSTKKSLGKKLAATQKQLDETNNMLIEQGKSIDKKIGVLSDGLAKANDAIAKLSK